MKLFLAEAAAEPVADVGPDLGFGVAADDEIAVAILLLAAGLFAEDGEAALVVQGLGCGDDRVAGHVEVAAGGEHAQGKREAFFFLPEVEGLRVRRGAERETGFVKAGDEVEEQ